MGLLHSMQMNGLRFELAQLADRLVALEAQAQAVSAQADEARLRLVASEKVAQGANLTRSEAAAFLGVSFRKVQRMDAAGALPRCRGFGAAVRYAARDVLRLASAPRKER